MQGVKKRDEELYEYLEVEYSEEEEFSVEVEDSEDDTLVPIAKKPTT